MDTVASGITRTISDRINTGNKDNHISEVVQNGIHKNVAET
jgi:hypothetical protein